jgi:hypothetical protein
MPIHVTGREFGYGGDKHQDGKIINVDLIKILHTCVRANCTLSETSSRVFRLFASFCSTFRIIVLHLPIRRIRGIGKILAAEGQKSCDFFKN